MWLPISNSVYDRAAKVSVLITELNWTIDCPGTSQPDVLDTLCATRDEKTQTFTKNVKAYLALLPPRNVAVFESLYLVQYHIQRTNNFTVYLVSQDIN